MKLNLNAFEIESILLTENDSLNERELDFKLNELKPTLDQFGVYPKPSDGEAIYPIYNPV
ncbi:MULTISPECIES: hypothetical protein [Vibrio]|uniref:hypothetical protein n=1 Tax=Vibrio TaxID=662 RepID=UPI00078B6C77|nr:MULTISPECIES: hypothetical protein [Vibrio]BAU70814.1 hypothetical protein [Vibrio sp. 04Ya108]BBM67617.1 hypothetical protein VA249_42630 [Vibrio alfacsensis]BCN27100.1 hypothetical protein VYA_42920 [Vibrio alfacsensis]